MTFTPEQIADLSAPLNRSHVKERKQAGRKLSYVEGWHVIAEANRIFGFDAWTRETFEVRCVAEHKRKIGQDGRDGWGVSYVAKVRITVGGVIREGIGAGHGIDADLGLAHESAIKEAETDATKRAMMTFGNPFGLALYDKEQVNVETREEETASDRYTRTSLGFIENAKTVDALRSWWEREKPVRAQFYTNDDPNFRKLRDAFMKRGVELSPHEKKDAA